MSTTDSNYNWQTDAQITKQEFRAGYEQEAGRGGLRPDERNDGRDDPIEYDHMEGTTSETTLYADRHQAGYNPNERLPSCEKHSTKRAKFTQLWVFNAGRDGHRIDGKTYKDKEIHKVDQPARERTLFVHAVANQCELPQKLTNYCTKLARRLDPRVFNYWGGMDTFILAIVGYVGDTLGDRIEWSGDYEKFEEIQYQWEVDTDDLGKAIGKLHALIP